MAQLTPGVLPCNKEKWYTWLVPALFTTYMHRRSEIDVLLYKAQQREVVYTDGIGSLHDLHA